MIGTDMARLNRARLDASAGTLLQVAATVSDEALYGRRQSMLMKCMERAVCTI